MINTNTSNAHHIAVDDVHIFSLSAVMPVCTTLHSPAPISDTALTLMLYFMPAYSPLKIVEVIGGEPERQVHCSKTLSHFVYTPPGTERWPYHFGEGSKSLLELVLEIPLSWSK